MERKVEHLSSTKRRITVEIPSEVIEDRIRDALRVLQRSVRIPGFRPGKAPLSLIDRKYGKDVETDVVEKIIPEYYARALKEENIIPVLPPVFESYDYKRRSPLTMTFVVEHRPEIKDLSYEDIKVEDEPIEVTEEDIKRAIGRVIESKSSYEPVDREAREDDVVVVDFEVEEENKKIENQIVQIGSELNPVELSDALKGKKKGESFECRATFPEDFVNKNYAGKTFTLKGVVREVKELRKPEFDDAFAKEMGFESLEAVKEEIKKAIEQTKREILESKQKEEIIDELLKRHEFEIPEGLLKEELEALVREKKREKPDAEEETLREELRDEAMRNVKIGLILDEIADRESIELTDEEVNDRILAMANSMYITPEQFVKIYLPNEEAYYRFRHLLLREKTLEHLLKKAKEKEEENNDQ